MIAGVGKWIDGEVAVPIEQCKARLQVQYDKNQELMVVLLMLLKSVSSSWDKVFDINDDFQNQFYILVGVIRNFHQYFENTKMSTPSINFGLVGYLLLCFDICLSRRCC